MHSVINMEQAGRAQAIGRRMHMYMAAVRAGRVDELIPCVVLDSHAAACAFVQGIDMIDVTPEQRAAMKTLTFALVQAAP